MGTNVSKEEFFKENEDGLLNYNPYETASWQTDKDLNFVNCMYGNAEKDGELQRCTKFTCKVDGEAKPCSDFLNQAQLSAIQAYVNDNMLYPCAPGGDCIAGSTYKFNFDASSYRDAAISALAATPTAATPTSSTNGLIVVHHTA